MTWAPLDFLLSVPTPIAIFVAVFALVLGVAPVSGAIGLARTARAGLLALSAGFASVALGLVDDVGAAAPNLPSQGSLGDSYQPIIALVLTALTGFALFFFARAQEDIKAAHRDAQENLNSLEKRVRLTERVEIGLRRVEIELMRARLVQDLSDDVEDLRMAINNLAGSNQGTDRTVRRERQILRDAVTQLRRVLEPARAQRFDGRPEVYVNLLFDCVGNVEEVVSSHNPDIWQKVSSTESLRNWLSLIVDEFNDQHALRDKARALRDRLGSG